MEKIKVTIPSDIQHGFQIVTGFLLLREKGWDVEIINQAKDKTNPFYDMPVVLAEYRGKKIFYDLWDGYQDPEGMCRGLAWCDFYFKRSFSEEKNGKLFSGFEEKLHPLGFNYHVTHRKNPVGEPAWKAMLKPLLGRAPDAYFVTERFEGKAERKDGTPVVLFLTRLWDSRDPALSAELNAERQLINEMRIEIIRTLKQRYGDAFIGGLNDTALSRELAPDLIMPQEYTERKKYLQLLHSVDICIGTMGLHESIGWKTSEYVAAAKAIVNERLHYTVPGDFEEGKNYLEFSTAQQCLDAVQKLMDDSEMLYEMKRRNAEYYQNYLRPDVLVRNSLETVERGITK